MPQFGTETNMKGKKGIWPVLVGLYTVLTAITMTVNCPNQLWSCTRVIQDHLPPKQSPNFDVEIRVDESEVWQDQVIVQEIAVLRCTFHSKGYD
jgi:hypothetical protein